LLSLAITRLDDDEPESPTSPPVPPSEPRPRKVRYFGDYELVEEIARGGMGVVYRARQVSLNRLVALKMIAAGQLATPASVQRFRTEAEAAARLDHPHIVPIYEVGEYEGQHYFSMKLVEGGTVADLSPRPKVQGPKSREASSESKAHSPQSTESAARLVATVARAVHYAHQRGILHRDLKPTNILLDSQGEPHVTDFGLAKLAEDDSSLTLSSVILGTPAYMAPEQAAGGAKQLTTAADIYSLGAILYELLTGQPPFRAETAVETLRRVCQEEPTRPSSLNRGVDRDLETICLKCLGKDPQKRYGSAELLAQDPDHWSNGEPIVARPVGTAERAWRWCRRRPVVAGLSAAVLFSLVAGLVVSNWFYLREKTAEQKQAKALLQAQASEKQARAVNRFLRDQFLFQATPELNASGRKITMQEVLERATSLLEMDSEIAQQPELEASLRLDFGMAYEALGDLPRSKRLLRRAFELRRSTLGPTNRETMAAEYRLARFLLIEAREFAELEGLYKEVWEGRRQLLGAEHPDTVDAMEGYEVALFEQGRLAEAETLARQILPIRERDNGINSWAASSALLNLSGPLGLLGDHAEAERLCREAVCRGRREGDLNSRPYFFATKELANQRLLQSDPQEAEKLLSNVLPSVTEQFGAEHPVTLWMQRVLARALAEQGRLAEAEALARTTLAARLSKTSDAQGTGRTLLVLGSVLVQQGKLDEAELRLQEALALVRDSVVRKEALSVQILNWLGAIQVARKAYPQAESLLLPGSERFFTPAAQMSSQELRLALAHIVTLYQGWGKPDQAAVWQKKLDSVSDVLTAQSLRVVTNGETTPTEVEIQYREVLATKRSVLGNDNSTLIATLCDLGAFLKAQGRPEAAAQFYRETLGLTLSPRTQDVVKLPAVVPKLAEELYSRGEREQADQLFGEAIAVARQKLGESHPAVDTLLDRFTDTLAHQGRSAAAAAQFLQAAQIRRAKPGYGFVETLYYLSGLQLSAGKLQDAERSLREALEVFRSGRWRENYNGEICLNSRLAEVLLQQQRLSEAEAYCHRAVAATLKYQGNYKQQFYHQSLFSLFCVLKAENKVAEADSVVERMLSFLRPGTVAVDLLDEVAADIIQNRPGDPQTHDFFLRRGCELLEKLPSEELPKASGVVFGLINAGLHQQATNLCWRMLDSPATNAGWFNGAAWHLATTENPSNRDPVLAVELAKRSLKLNDRGDWNTLGVARYRTGDYKQALLDLEKSAEGDHDLTSFNSFFMAMAHHHLGNADAARSYHDQAIMWMSAHAPQNPELIRFRAEAEELLGPLAQASPRKPSNGQ
jgi:tetratricopeptide (TPR) repeat protein